MRGKEIEWNREDATQGDKTITEMTRTWINTSRTRDFRWTGRVVEEDGSGNGWYIPLWLRRSVLRAPFTFFVTDFDLLGALS